MAAPPRRPPQSGNPLYSLKHQASTVLRVSPYAYQPDIPLFLAEQAGQGRVSRIARVLGGPIIAAEENWTPASTWSTALRFPRKAASRFDPPDRGGRDR